jgi:PAS domain S-box-containing protein
LEPSKKQLLAENADLRARLEEAEETLEALRRGEVDALVVSLPAGEQVFTLKGADYTYRHLVENISEGAATLTAEGDILYANEKLAQILDRPLSRVMGSSLQDYIAVGDRNLFEALLSRARTGGSKGEVPLQSGNGPAVPTYLSFSRLNLEDPPGALSLVVTDLTQQKRQEAMVADGKLSQEILWQAEQPIAVCDRSGLIIRASRGLQELCGLNPLLLPFYQAFPLVLSSGRTFLSAPLFKGQTLCNVEVSCQRPGDGRQFHLMLNAGPLLDEDRKIEGFVMALTDITGRKDAEAEKQVLLEKLQAREEELRVTNEDLQAANEGLQVQMEELKVQTKELQAANEELVAVHSSLRKSEAQLLQAQKLEAIGTLAGGIAHDFNNILWAMLGFTEMTLMNLPENSPESSYLKKVMQAGGRAKDLVEQILAFSRKSVKEKAPLRLSLIIKEALKLLRATLPTTIEILTQINTPEAMVLADASQIHQVLMNLCTNAAHALQENGDILTVGLDEVMVDSASPALNTGLPPGPYVVLTVRDNGPGMEPAVLSRIFEPFFTTKGVGEGSGMGLSVVHGIVKSHGGEITVTSEKGRGTTFKVFLPLVSGEEKPAPVYSSPAPSGTGRILCVDDEPVLVELLQVELGRLGYDVTGRSSSAQALELFLAHPDQFDLVITDQTMPFLTGLQLADEVRRVRADLPVIICTGYSDKVSEETIQPAGINKMLKKPVDLRQLGEAVRELLDTDT